MFLPRHFLVARPASVDGIALPSSVSRRRPSAPVAESMEPRTLLAVGPAALLKDVNTSTPSSSPDATSFIAYKGQTWFRANDGVHGVEWWRTDGTAAGTSLFMDLNPGGTGSDRRGTLLPAIGPGIRTAAVVGDTLFFTAFMPGTGAELWKTDGTVEGTVLVKDTRPGPLIPSYPPQRFMAAGNLLYFMADDGTHGVQLWKSDGTADGTVPLTSISNGGPIVPIGALGDKLIFSAFSPDAGGPGGREPWVTDGTPAGTMLLKNIHPTNASNPASGLVPDPTVAVIGNTMYFRATDSAHGVELWKTDGTPAGTVLAADIIPGAGSSFPGNLANVAGQLYFSADGANPFDSHVYRLDPAGGAAVQVRGSLVVGSLGSGSSGAVGGKYFIGGWWNNQAALFMHNPANPDAPLTLVKNLGPSGNWPAGGPIVDDDGVALLLVPDLSGNKSINLWRSDGTPDGTFVLRSTANPSTFPDPNAYERGTLARGANGLFYYVGRAAGTRDDVYRTDGTAAGTGRLAVANSSTQGSNPGGVVDLGNGRGVFTASDSQHGTELWATDGTGGGTTLLKDINPGPAGSIGWLTNVRDGRVETFSEPLNGRVYFPAVGPADNTELWTTDGTEAGTRLVKDFNPFGGSFPTQFTVAGGRMYFLNGGLWVTDGTEAGTQAVSSLGMDSVGGLVTTNPVVVGDAMYLLVHRSDPTGGTNASAELWRSDGTTAGTYLVKVVAPSGHAFGTDQFGDGPPAAALDGLLYFLARAQNLAPVLWRSDGTAAGTVRLTELPGTTAAHLTVANGRLLFGAGIPGAIDNTLTTVWTSDGTTAAPIAGKASLTHVTALTAAGDAAYFLGQPVGSSEWELWRTDGTEAGTRRLTRASSTIRILNVVDGVLYFSQFSTAAGREAELWRSDGTEAGTALVQATRPGGVGGASVTNVTGAGGWLFFDTDDGQHGVEPWSMPLRPVVAGRWAFYHHSAPADSGATEAVATDKVALLPGRSASSANVTSYDRGINGVIVDVAGLPGGASLTAADFSFRSGRPGAPAFSAGPSTVQVTVSPGAGVNGSVRVTLTWPDYNPAAGSPLAQAVANGWLEVTVKANGNTGLASPDVFSFGNLIGDTGDSRTNLRVNALDLAAVKRLLNTDATPTSAADFNRDGRINALDLGIVKQNLNHTLAMPSAQNAAPAVQAAFPRGLFSDGGVSTTRRLAEELLA